MDSQLLLYTDMPSSGTTSKSVRTPFTQGQGTYTALFNEDSIPDFAALDPSFESSQNIQDLIAGEGLFQDLLPAVGETECSRSEPSAIDDNVKPTSLHQPNDGEVQAASVHQVIDPQFLLDSLFLETLPSAQPIEYMTPLSDIELSENQDGVSTLALSAHDLASLGLSLGIEGADETQAELSVKEESLGSYETESKDASNKYQLKAEAPSKTITRGRRQHEKGSQEYVDRRERNNVAVRKSRDKSKIKQRETEGKVKELTTENERLQKKVDLLTKELTVLKGLFTNVGANLPEKIHMLLK